MESTIKELMMPRGIGTLDELFED